ncbi:MAG: ATP phosphoribosyltransferase regulatory subunit [Alphaproteobacteria bacterium]|nr:ATP phosphoribosyltransferase regulatory subunit [Alphaproteobacteria bacterium]
MNTRQTRIKAEAARLSAIFIDAGAIPVETACLQPAETLLDLYGEDIRARAYVTHDPQGGEMMLRPDFTVPVVQMHMNEGAEPARYTYNGPVWRKQQAGSARAREYLQVGFELFDRSNPAASDAEVFALFADALKGKNLRAATGDLGILMAAVSGLSTIEPRKSALKRHIWRPKRFRQLLERFGGGAPVLASRAALLEAATHTSPADLCREAGNHVGLRSIEEISARVEKLQADAAASPIDPAEMRLLESILNMREKAPVALENLRRIEADMPSIGPALDRMEARLDALATLGIDVQALDFEGSYGRTTLEYYDGFVFGFYAEGRADLPAIASGGRYDALCEVLGQGRTIPAVGGVIRPELIEAMEVRDGD